MRFPHINYYMPKILSVVTNHSREPQQVAVVQRWSVFGGFSIKIGIKHKRSLAGLSIAIFDR
jgi:hypothetical protein